MNVAANFGKNGLVDGEKRRQGNLQTPTGIWTIGSFLFGLHPSPPAGTLMPYRPITPDSYWSSVRDSTYNTWVGHRVSGEHLIDADPQYEYAFNTGYNSPPNERVIGRGTAIFIHCFEPPDNNLGKYTHGCVAISRENMIELFTTAGPHPESHVCDRNPRRGVTDVDLGVLGRATRPYGVSPLCGKTAARTSLTRSAVSSSTRSARSAGESKWSRSPMLVGGSHSIRERTCTRQASGTSSPSCTPPSSASTHVQASGTTSHDVVSPAAQRREATVAELVGEADDPAHQRAIAGNRETELRLRIVVVRVDAQLRDDEVRPKRAGQRDDHFVEGEREALVGGVGRQRDVRREPLARPVAALAGEAGPGKRVEAALVDRDRQHLGRAGERLLHAIAVMGVDVDVEDPQTRMLLPRDGDSDRGVVVDREASRPAPVRVVHAAGDRERAQLPSGEHLLDRPHRASAGQRRDVVHPGVDRVVLGAEAHGHPRAESPVARLAHRLDVADRVHQKQFVLSRGVRRDDDPGTEEAECRHQLDRERKT